MYSCVLEDSKLLPNMSLLVEQMSQLHYMRESAMRILSRHPVVILDCGVYCAEAPAPNPILPIDTCTLRIGTAQERTCELQVTKWFTCPIPRSSP